MPKFPKPKKVLTPGSQPNTNKSFGGIKKKKKSSVSSGRKSSESSGKRSESSGKKSPGGKRKSGEGKNPNRKRKGTARKGNYRSSYSEEDMLAAVNLVINEGYSKYAAAKATNVKRQTLTDRLLKYQDPLKVPRVGRPQELSVKEEEDIVDCLSLCSEFQYPMRKRDVRKLVQSYVLENDVEVRWPNGKPGAAWVKNFQRRWSHKVKVKKPTNIKRSRGKVSPTIVRDFITRLTPNVEGVPATHFFNYDETNLKDDPGMYLGTVTTVPVPIYLGTWGGGGTTSALLCCHVL